MIEFVTALITDCINGKDVFLDLLLKQAAFRAQKSLSTFFEMLVAITLIQLGRVCMQVFVHPHQFLALAAVVFAMVHRPDVILGKGRGGTVH